MRFLTKTMTKSFIASRRTSNHHEIDDTRKHQQKLNVPVREGKMRGSPFVPFFFARLLRAHNGKRVGQSRSIEQVRVFQTTKKKTEICNPKFNTMFFFLLLLLTKYLHYISTKTASTTGPRFSRRAQRKRSRSSLYSNDEIFIDSSLQRLDDVGFERVSTVAGFFHR
jgi:hypothetical protein